jgi:hypothetical protein
VPARPPVRVLIAVGLLAGSTLALQVVMTRIFAAVLFYHFAFLAISLALLGVGAGAVLLYVRPAWFERVPLERAMARWSLAFAGLLLVSLPILVRLNYEYGGVSAKFILNLGAACVLAGLPFLAAGVAIALAVRGYAGSIGRLYAFDLAGAGIGALAVVPVMWVLPAPALAAALALSGVLAAALFGRHARAELRMAGAAALVAGAALALSGPTGAFYLAPLNIHPDADRWTPISRVIGVLPADRARNGLVVYDRVLGEIVPHRRGTPPPSWRRLQLGPQSVGYALKPGGDSLVIGGGGGRDILNALSERQRHVDVIELNRSIRKVVDEDLGDFSGSPYSLPRVSTAIGDGRSTLAERDKRYDEIHIGFTDTFSANSAQAFALTENNLYTVEAFDEYFDHLKPGGVLNVSRPQHHLGEEALRATVLTLDALRRRGVERPERNVAVLLGNYHAPFKDIPYGTILAKAEPFTQGQLATIRRLAAARGQGVALAPGGTATGEWAALSRATSLDAFCHSYRLNVCPPTDDKPFFFHMKRLGDIGGEATSANLGVPDPMLILAITLGLLLVLSALAFGLPLALVPSADRPSLGAVSFFAGTGLGFLLLEVVLIQRFVLFLGFPTYALSVVLFSLLVFTGIGSFVSTRAERAPRRSLCLALAAAIVMIAAVAFGLQPLLRALIDLPFAARVAAAILLLAPVGVTLGMVMPLGLRRLLGLYPRGVPWAWGINGVTSVLASVLAIAIATNYGFTVTTLVALACYAGVLAHALLGRWPDPESGEPGRVDGAASRGGRERAIVT